MSPNIHKIPFDQMEGCFLDFGTDKTGVILGFAQNHGQIIGLLVEEVPEADPLFSKKCPKCKYVETLEKSVNGISADKQEVTPSETPLPTADNPQEKITQLVKTPLRLVIHSNPNGAVAYEIIGPKLSSKEAEQVANYICQFYAQMQKNMLPR